MPVLAIGALITIKMIPVIVHIIQLNQMCTACTFQRQLALPAKPTWGKHLSFGMLSLFSALIHPKCSPFCLKRMRGEWGDSENGVNGVVCWMIVRSLEGIPTQEQSGWMLIAMVFDHNSVGHWNNRLVGTSTTILPYFYCLFNVMTKYLAFLLKSNYS